MVRKKNRNSKLKSTRKQSTRKQSPDDVIVKSYALTTNNCAEELLIGKILIGATINFPPEKWIDCRLSFLCAPEEVDRINIQFDEISVLVTLIIDTEVLKEIITANIFSFNFSLLQEELFMDVYFRKLPLPKFNTRIGNCLKTLFTIVQKIPLLDLDTKHIDHSNTAQQINELFKLASAGRTTIDDLSLDNVQHSSLKPELRPYQKDAVRWMLNKERNIEDEKEMLHPLYTPVKLASGMEIYFDMSSGFITSTKPLVNSVCKGGVLAEEMGLGKTVEFLALTLNHPYVYKKEEDDEDSKNLTTNGNCSDSEASDNENVDFPVIKIQPKKKLREWKKRKINNSKQPEYEYKARDIKVPEDWVKSKRKKSMNYVALNLWYNTILSGMNVGPSRPVQTIQCICGEDFDSGKIKCTDCGKFQHKDCLQYKKSFGPFRCPSCWLEYPLIESGATLIVTPVSLRTQWCNEISMHVNQKLKVLVYEGSNKSPVYPTYLKNFDIVITTYNVLQSEFHLSEKGEVCELRRKRKYDHQFSPLSRIKWWRLCLDEAQTVDSPNKIVSAMAKKFTAQFRWAITGTPISKDISDLYGLIEYLQIEPFNDLETWKHILYIPYLNGRREPMCSFLSKYMWRSSKADVIDQIHIPEQTIVEHLLEFSAVEKFFYNKEHEMCSQAFLAALRNIDTTIPLSKLNKSELKKIMGPFLSLRQVCTHPHTTRGKYLATKKKVSTMKELLNALITKNSTESEEYLRLVVSSLNGLAGIYLLMQYPVEAAAEYRKVMQLSARFSEENKELNLTVDKLQLIHTMHNLADLLEANANIPPTLHDSTLRDDCKILEQKYIEKFIKNTMAAYHDSNNAQKTTAKLYDKFMLKEGQWYSDGIDWVFTNNLTDDFANRIRNMHCTAHIKCPIDLICPRSILSYVCKWDEELTNNRADLITLIDRLYTYKEHEEYKIIVDKSLVASATDCHLRQQKKSSKDTRKKQGCLLCLADKSLKKYEFKLYSMAKRTITFADMSLSGSWKPASQELILKALYQILRVKDGSEVVFKDGYVHLEILDNLKKEFKEIRKFWTHIYQQVAAHDEVDMCKIKLRLEDPHKDKNSKKSTTLKQLSYILENKVDTIYMLNEHELDHHMMLLRSDETKGSNDLEKSLGIKSYLETLRKQQYEGQSPDPCPICRNVLDQHWSILTCGHNYCMECIHRLFQQSSKSILICCVCRQAQQIQDISYIKSSATNNDNTDVEIRGNFSTKIEAVIKFLIELKDKDENVKVLVFSTWIAALKSLKEALTLNDITTEILLSHKLEDRIENFKNEKHKITALLLPISLGGKGLNLIEATHVILIEPLLNPGDESQAIGRIHRIGQTRPTFVHKFCIKNTIEESLFIATKTDTDEWDTNNVTLDHLKGLFVKVDQCTENTVSVS